MYTNVETRVRYVVSAPNKPRKRNCVTTPDIGSWPDLHSPLVACGKV